jgi:phosphatidylglycerophosphatase A
VDIADMTEVREKTEHHSRRELLSDPGILIATVGGAGFVPIAPGTLGSLLGFPLYWGLSALGPAMAVAAGCCLLAISTWAAHRSGHLLGEHDHSAIICDETMAMAIVLFGAPAGLGWNIFAFLLFRLFDVVKPWPANLVDRRMQSGLGVMLDDLIAAAYAIGFMMAVSWLGQRF